jgi:hypothetical protein
MRQTTLMIAVASILTAAPQLRATDWILAPSTYTHDPQTGERIAQFAPVPPVYLRAGRPDYVESGYRHRQSVIRDRRGGADRLHITQEWGRPVRPYGEWRFPYRPYAVPYPLWGPPFANYHFSSPSRFGPRHRGSGGPGPHPSPGPDAGGPGNGTPPPDAGHGALGPT